jgi:DNA polymerase III subunit epsilon
MAIRVTPKNQAPLSEITFIVLDLETTGASPANGCAITEIGAIAVRGGEILEEFSTFVNPQVALPEYIINLTGITDEMLVGAPLIDQAFPDFIEFINRHKDVHLVAHNAPFDIGFLKAAAAALSHDWPKYEVIDTVKLARRVIDRSEILNYKLGTLSQFFDTKALPNHRALG